MTSRSLFVPTLSAALALAFAAVVGPGCNSHVDGGGSGDGSCTVGDVVHADGSSFLDADGCNSCTCENGSVACTLMACLAECEYDGVLRTEGESFPSTDGCNTCTCMHDGSVACTEMGCPAGCEYGGVLYSVDESFPAGDGCNTCTCLEGGSVACTDMACPEGCDYSGVHYQPGDSFPALDGCNTCSCMADGSVACTEIACECDPPAEWYRDYVSTDPAQCQVIDYACPEATTMFTNACGCGCEQSAACPEWFDCMPPAACDIDQIEHDCPYSGIAL